MKDEKIILIISLVILVCSYIILRFSKSEYPKQARDFTDLKNETYYNCVDVMARNFKDIDNCNKIK